MFNTLMTLTPDELRILGSIVATIIALPSLLTVIAMALK